MRNIPALKGDFPGLPHYIVSHAKYFSGLNPPLQVHVLSSLWRMIIIKGMKARLPLLMAIMEAWSPSAQPLGSA